MTPDQIAQLATVEANYTHIMAALEQLKKNVEALPTHKDLSIYATSAELNALRSQVEELKRNSPGSIWEKAVRFAGGLMALYGAWQLLQHITK